MLLSGTAIHKSTKRRKIKHVCWIGGSALLDGHIEIYYGS